MSAGNIGNDQPFGSWYTSDFKRLYDLAVLVDPSNSGTRRFIAVSLPSPNSALPTAHTLYKISMKYACLLLVTTSSNGVLSNKFIGTAYHADWAPKPYWLPALGQRFGRLPNIPVFMSPVLYNIPTLSIANEFISPTAIFLIVAVFI